jgi:hypothetical protein
VVIVMSFYMMGSFFVSLGFMWVYLWFLFVGLFCFWGEGSGICGFWFLGFAKGGGHMGFWRTWIIIVMWVSQCLCFAVMQHLCYAMLLLGILTSCVLLFLGYGLLLLLCWGIFFWFWAS